MALWISVEKNLWRENLNSHFVGLINRVDTLLECIFLSSII